MNVEDRLLLTGRNLRAAEAYHEICEHPERSIKLGVDHTR